VGDKVEIQDQKILAATRPCLWLFETLNLKLQQRRQSWNIWLQIGTFLNVIAIMLRS